MSGSSSWDRIGERVGGGDHGESGFLEKAAARVSTRSGVDERLVALDVDHVGDLRVRGTASAMRSVPLGWSGEVMTTVRAEASAASRMRWIVGRHEDEVEAGAIPYTRSKTCWRRGFPASGWSGFPGKREDPHRAGMIPAT